MKLFNDDGFMYPCKDSYRNTKPKKLKLKKLKIKLKIKNESNKKWK